MMVMQMPPQSATTNVVDAIWALVQCQTKSVQRALTKRFVALDNELRTQKANTVSLDLMARLEASREDIEAGKGVRCNTKEELHSFLASL